MPPIYFDVLFIPNGNRMFVRERKNPPQSQVCPKALINDTLQFKPDEPFNGVPQYTKTIQDYGRMVKANVYTGSVHLNTLPDYGGDMSISSSCPPEIVGIVLRIIGDKVWAMFQFKN